MKMILSALALLALTATASQAAPPIIPWEVTTHEVFRDTLVTGANQSAGDTVYFSSPAIGVFGARVIAIEAFAETLSAATGLYSPSADTIATPLVLWDVAGTGTYAPLAAAQNTGVYAVPTGGLNLTTSGGIVATYYSSMDQTPGGAPSPVVMRNIKIKMKNNTQRFKNYTNAQILTVNGPNYNKVPRLTVRVHVWR